MKLKITTYYFNATDKWLDWWVKNQGPNYGVKKLNDLPVRLESEDPATRMIGQTTIELISDEQKQ